MMTPAYAPATGPVRARCPSCRHRFAWPAGLGPTGPDGLSVGAARAPRVACPACLIVRRLTPEPLDESWWKYLQGDQVTQAAPA